MPAFTSLPSLLDLFENPKLLLQLPQHYVDELMTQARRLVTRVDSTAIVPRTPVEMAVSNPRFRWMDTPHLHHLGDEIEQLIEQAEENNNSDSGMVNDPAAAMVTMPPRHAKSNTCSVWTPFWYLARFPDRQVFLISHSDAKARAWGITVRRLVEVYGHLYGLELHPKHKSSNDWQLISGGGMKTVGAGGSISGNMVDLLILDDVIKDDADARSEVLRESMWSWWETTVLQRIEARTVTIIIGTRYHEDDLLGRILKFSANGEGLKVHHITLPATAEADDPLGREIGEGLWTSHAGWGQAYYDKRRAAVSAYVWNSVYQQRPSSPGGNIVDPEWFSFYLPAEKPLAFDRGAQSWDLSLDAEKKTDSYHAGGVAGCLGPNVYILDLFHEHCESIKVVDTVILWDKLYAFAKTKIVERSIAGPFMVQMLRSIVGGFYLWPPKGKQKGSKQAALEACVPIIRGGNVFLPLLKDGTKPKIVQDFLEELRQFPRAPHDDFVDMISQLLNFFFPAVHEAKETQKKAALQAAASANPPSLVQQHVSSLHSLLRRMQQPRIDAMKNAQRRERELSTVVVDFERFQGSRRHRPSLGRSSGMGGRRSTRGMW